LGILVAVVIVLVAGISAVAYAFVRHETRFVLRPAAAGGRRVRRAPRAAAGDTCVCGGTLGKTGKTSPRWGELLGCTGCDRSWTMDGRRILRRRVRRPVAPG
jgi:hypothetical protein